MLVATSAEEEEGQLDAATAKLLQDLEDGLQYRIMMMEKDVYRISTIYQGMILDSYSIQLVDLYELDRKQVCMWCAIGSVFRPALLPPQKKSTEAQTA